MRLTSGLLTFLLTCLPVVSGLPSSPSLLKTSVDLIRRTRSDGAGRPAGRFFKAYDKIRVPLDGQQLSYENKHVFGEAYGTGTQQLLSTLKEKAPPLEVHQLLTSGPSKNRVDLVFFSDGYTLSEKVKFLDDARRLAEDVSGNQTFHTVKPLLNFWAAFSPSAESGIGVGGKPKDTPFGLYRDGTELRGVYYAKPEVAAAACASLGDQCDYPILLGNDPLYGGLGGDFTVITSSLANGPLVLRHELGHSIIEVGEEYDGGFAYFGPNAANTSSPISWSHWLSDPKSDSPGHSPRIERSVMPMQAYPWTMLNATTPWSTRFNSSGRYPRHLLKFSLSGIPNAEDVRVELDGEDLGWVPRTDIGVDRWHYDISQDSRLADGPHEIKFTLRNKDREGTAQLCSLEILEFGDETEFVNKPGHYGVFPTFSDKNETMYRPTNEDCLMRAVVKPNFCKVCTEGLWLSLLKRVELIDDVVQGCEWQYDNSGDPASNSGEGKWYRTLEARIVPLAQLRSEPMVVSESLAITWKRDGKTIEEFANLTRISVDDEQAQGRYSLEVKYDTEEIRFDKKGWTISESSFIVAEKCSRVF